jgi:hypothetical protein
MRVASTTCCRVIRFSRRSRFNQSAPLFTLISVRSRSKKARIFCSSGKAFSLDQNVASDEPERQGGTRPSSSGDMDVVVDFARRRGREHGRPTLTKLEARGITVVNGGDPVQVQVHVKVQDHVKVKVNVKEFRTRSPALGWNTTGCKGSPSRIAFSRMRTLLDFFTFHRRCTPFSRFIGDARLTLSST